MKECSNLSRCSGSTQQKGTKEGTLSLLRDDTWTSNLTKPGTFGFHSLKTPCNPRIFSCLRKKLLSPLIIDSQEPTAQKRPSKCSTSRKEPIN